MTWIPISVTTTGGAGVSAGNASKALIGDSMLINVHIPTQATLPGTTGVLIKAIMGDGSLVTLVTLTAVAVPYYGALQITSVNGTGAAGGLVNPVVSGLNIAITGANDGTQTVWIDAVFLGN